MSEKVALCYQKALKSEGTCKASSMFQITPKCGSADAKLLSSGGLVIFVLFHDMPDDGLVHFV